MDDLTSSYVAWRAAAATAQASYDQWRTASFGARDFGFGLYVAALDREERAARAYRQWIERQVATEPNGPANGMLGDLVARLSAHKPGEGKR